MSWSLNARYSVGTSLVAIGSAVKRLTSADVEVSMKLLCAAVAVAAKGGNGDRVPRVNQHSEAGC